MTPTGPATVSPPPALTCSVLGESRGRNVLLQGRIVSPGTVVGSFQLLVETVGPGGRSRVAQGGHFAAEPGAPLLVGSMTVSMEAGARIEARIAVTVDGRRFTCRPYTGERT